MDFDLLVIGAGSGGVRAARMSAQTGIKVAIVDGAALGGTCVNVGCVPKKLYSYAAHYAHALKDMAGYGFNLNGQVSFNWDHLKQQRATEIARLNAVYARLLDNAGVRLIKGWGSLLDSHTVQVRDHQGETQTYTAKRILIAPGSEAFIPEIEGREHVITSNEVFDLPVLPKRMLIVGGGYIACEFACIFNALGVHVDQVIRSAHLLRAFDEDIASYATQEIEKAGVHLIKNSTVTKVTASNPTYAVTLNSGEVLSGIDVVMYATGRVPRTKGLGLDKVGIQLNQQGAIEVNEFYQTNVPSIYAIGDVINHMQLTPVATSQAMVLVDRLYGEGKRRLSYENIPTAVFTYPNIGTVGLTEKQAIEAGYVVDIYQSEFRAMKHTLSGASVRTLMKLIVDQATDRVLGLHMVGEDAGEIVQGFAVALKVGATKADFDATVGIHPTSAEEFVTMRTKTRTSGI
ncbi:MAG: glutathione-disulfide reductase [Alcaligenaceae bacterium]|nr:glutathione-disulfide reductase [Alcaligenaceae bacterium]